MKNLLKSFFILIAVLSSLRAIGQQTASTPQFRQEFLERINRIREKGCNCGVNYMPPVPPLVWNDQLEIATVGHAMDMAERNYFSHTSIDGRTMQNRIGSAGYSYKGYKSYAIGENIAEGPVTIKEVMEGWLNSPGHCKNLMSREFKEVGVAEYHGYWVQDFGGRESFSPEVQRLIKSGKYRLIEKE
jgi:uncharacterized protein YkwD